MLMNITMPIVLGTNAGMSLGEIKKHFLEAVDQADPVSNSGKTFPYREAQMIFINDDTDESKTIFVWTTAQCILNTIACPCYSNKVIIPSQYEVVFSFFYNCSFSLMIRCGEKKRLTQPTANAVDRYVLSALFPKPCE